MTRTLIRTASVLAAGAVLVLGLAAPAGTVERPCPVLWDACSVDTSAVELRP